MKLLLLGVLLLHIQLVVQSCDVKRVLRQAKIIRGQGNETMHTPFSRSDDSNNRTCNTAAEASQSGNHGK